MIAMCPYTMSGALFFGDTDSEQLGMHFGNNRCDNLAFMT